MEGAGKGSKCIKTLRERERVRVHRNLKCINAWRWRGKCPRLSILSLPSCKTWRGGKRVRVRKGPSASKCQNRLQRHGGAGKGSEYGNDPSASKFQSQNRLKVGQEYSQNRKN